MHANVEFFYVQSFMWFDLTWFQGLKHVLLTIKCLLIVPNPESALNEEAGKLLLERYDDYCTRAKIYTEIHAKPKNSDKASSSSTSDGGASSAASSETLAKKACNGVVAASATDKKALAKKEKSLKDKKKTLKRLWTNLNSP